MENLLVTATEQPAPEPVERALPLKQEEVEAFSETLEDVEACEACPVESVEPEAAPPPPPRLERITLTVPRATEVQAAPAPATPVKIVTDLKPLREVVLPQLRVPLPIPGEAKEVQLTPVELGTVKIQVSAQASVPSVEITASQSLVGAMLENSAPQLKGLFFAQGMDPGQVTVILGASASAGAGDQPNDPFSSFLGHDTARPQATFVDTSAPGAEALLAQRYGIRDVHQHLMDQIRIAMDPSRNEAKIRLHPPELGDIRIHLVMEDKGLTVRMDVAEHLTRSLLERDLEQLKNTLADAGIEVSRFDIHSEQQRSRMNKEQNKEEYTSEATEEEKGAGLDEPVGAVEMDSRRKGVDYLVY